MSWRESVNQTVGSAVLADINKYFVSSPWPKYSPIDGFYGALRGLLAASVPGIVAPHPVLGPLVLVGIVSATENYFRELLSRLVYMCPVARAASADQSIKLGSVLWHNGVQVERGAFEHFSFADSESIKKACRNFVGVDLKPGGATGAILDEFDRVCELRHGIVHCCSVLAGKNAIKLQVGRSSERLEIKCDYPLLQESALVCTTLVTGFNKELFGIMAGRWAVEWRKRPSWEPKRERELFKEVWRTFFSTVDEGNASLGAVMSHIQCRREVRKEFNLV